MASNGVTELWLRVPSPRGMIHYRPLPAQAEFHADTETKHRWFCGGMGCVAAETLIGGVPAAERAAGSVDTLFGPAEATATYLKGRAPLYRVATRSGRVVEVTDEHRFLTPVGWRQLRHLAVGDVIAADGSGSDPTGSRTGEGSRAGCSLGLHRNDGLPSPEEVVGLAAVVVHWLSPASFPLAVARTRRPISRASCDTEAAKTTPDHFIGHAVVFGNLGARFSRQIP
jgi:hypothetical protein